MKTQSSSSLNDVIKKIKNMSTNQSEFDDNQSSLKRDIHSSKQLRMISVPEFAKKNKGIFEFIDILRNDIKIKTQIEKENLPFRKDIIICKSNPVENKVPTENNYTKTNFDNTNEVKSTVIRNKNDSVEGIIKGQFMINNFFHRKNELEFREFKKSKNIFDSLDDKNTEIENENHKGSSVLINSNSRCKIYWDLYIFILIFYSITVSSYRMCFDLNNEFSVLFAFECVIDFSFIIDFLMQFFLTYRSQGIVIKNHSQICKQYLKSWFIIDLLSSFPSNILSLIFMYTGNPLLTSSARLYKSFSWLKIFRFSKMGKRSVFGLILTRLRITSDKSVNRVIKLSILVILLVHISSCIWIYIGLSSYPVTWIKKNNLINSPTSEIYIASLYFNFVTVYTIGYGDITATNTAEIAFSILFMIFGGFLFSLNISCLSMVFFSNKNKDEAKRKKLELLSNYKRDYKIPQKMFLKIRKTIEHQMHFSNVEKYSILDFLTDNLKKELHFVMNKELINDFKILQNKPSNFVLFVLNFLKPILVTKGEKLISIGDYVDEVYFVKSGKVSIEIEQNYNKIQIGSISNNFHFGDILLYNNETSPYMLKVSSKNTQIFTIKKNEFSQIISNFGVIATEVLSDSLNFIKILEKRRRIISMIYEFELDIKNSKKKIYKLGYNLLDKYFDQFESKGEELQDPFLYLDKQNDNTLINFFTQDNFNFEGVNSSIKTNNEEVIKDKPENFNNLLIRLSKFHDRLIKSQRLNKFKELQSPINGGKPSFFKNEMKEENIENKRDTEILNKIFNEKSKRKSLKKNRSFEEIKILNKRKTKNKYSKIISPIPEIIVKHSPKKIKNVEETCLKFDRKSFMSKTQDRQSWKRNKIFLNGSTKIFNRKKTNICSLNPKKVFNKAIEDNYLGGINEEIKNYANLNYNNDRIMGNLKEIIYKNDLMLKESNFLKKSMKKLDRIFTKMTSYFK